MSQNFRGAALTQKKNVCSKTPNLSLTYIKLHAFIPHMKKFICDYSEIKTKLHPEANNIDKVSKLVKSIIVIL